MPIPDEVLPPRSKAVRTTVVERLKPNRIRYWIIVTVSLTVTLTAVKPDLIIPLSAAYLSGAAVTWAADKVR